MADRGGLGGERSGDYGDGSRGNSPSADRNPSGEGNDPMDRNALRKFGGRKRPRKETLSPVERRILEERMRAANRLGFTQTILGGRPPTAGRAGTLKKRKAPAPAVASATPLSGVLGGTLGDQSGKLPLAVQEFLARRQRDA